MKSNMISFMGRIPFSPARLCGKTLRKLAHSVLVFAISLAFILVPYPPVGPTEAHAARGDRTLWLHFTHTGEEKKITFRRNGKYDPKGLKELEWIVRDWRQNQSSKMDPRLFDLIWSVYQESGATKAIRVVSGFRSKKTNDKLRRRSRGVARTSQHTAGKAMDFFIPGVPVKRLREIGLKMQAGGVGYYPGSRTPFVHMDTGRVRHWPRMTPKQVAALFPDGKTLHKDTRGRHGRQYAKALAEYEARKSKIIQPLSKSKRTLFASNKSDNNKAKPKRAGGLLAGIFKGGKKDNETNTATPSALPQTPSAAPQIIANNTTATEAAPIPSRIGRAAPSPTADIVAPVARPSAPTTLALAPTPRPVPEGLRDAFTPQQSIVVANAPSPIERPEKQVAPQVVIAKANIPEESLPRAIDSTKTAALSRSDFNVPTPKIVQNRLALADSPAAPKADNPIPSKTDQDLTSPDPTQLVLNDKLKEPVDPTASPETNSELAYANADDVAESLPDLDANEFNNRFGKAKKGSSDGSGVPVRVIKELTEAERVAALQLQQEAEPEFSLNDIGIESEDRQLALRQSLGLAKDDAGATQQNDPTQIASIEPNALAPNDTLAPATDAQESVQLPKEQIQKETQPQQTVSIEQDRSLTHQASAFTFAGENKQIVQTLLTAASVSGATRSNLQLPQPGQMPDLFIEPSRAYAGSFKTAQAQAPAQSFTGNAITLTPTVEFDPKSKVRLSLLSSDKS